MEDDPGFYPARTDWSKSTGKLNVSAFIYRDRNRSGRYDGNDRPMAGIAVAVTGDGLPTLAERSNSSGWANFAMSTTDPEAAIREPGPRQFTIIPPPGWVVTSGNAEQDAVFRGAEGSVAGLILDNALENIGLAPELTIRGRVASKASIRVETAGRSFDIAPGASDGGFHIPAEPGRIALAAGSIARGVELSELPVDLGLFDEKREISTAQSVEYIDFDGVTGMDLCKISSGYRGLDFFNLTATKSAFYLGEGYVNGSVLGTYVAYNSSGFPAEIASVRPFDFISCALSAAWLDAEGETVSVEAWRGDKPVARDYVVLSALGPVRYEPRLAGVTRLRFATAHHWQFVLDGLAIAR